MIAPIYLVIKTVYHKGIESSIKIAASFTSPGMARAYVSDKTGFRGDVIATGVEFPAVNGPHERITYCVREV